MGDTGALEKIGYKAVLEGFAAFDQNMQKMSKDVNLLGGAMDKEAVSASKATAAAKDNTSAMDKLSKSVMKGYDSYLEFAAQAGVAYGVLRGAYEAVDAMIQPTIELAEQTRELQLMTGATAEEAGMLIQAADDCFVSFDTLSTGMKNAIRKGFEPTIDGLGRMSDEYNAIQDPIEKTAYLMDVFGRSGSDVAELMSKGSDAIAEMGQSAYEAGLVLSQDGVDAAYEYKRAMDNLNDSVLAIKLSIGEKLIPVLLSAIDTTNLLITAQDQIVDSSKPWVQEINDTAQSAEEYEKRVRELAEAAGYMVRVNETGIHVMQRFGTGYKEVTEELGIYNAIQVKNNIETEIGTAKIEELGEAMSTAADDIDLINMRFDEHATAAEEAARQDKYYTEQMEELDIFMSGKLGKTIDNFNDKQIDLKKNMEETSARIAELRGQDYMTSEQQAELDTLLGKYKDMADQYAQNATEHRLATASILLDIVSQQLAMSEIPIEEQFIAISALAESWGLIDETTADVYQTIGKYVDQLDKGSLSAAEFARILEGIPDEIDVTVNLRDNAGGNWFNGGNNQNVGNESTSNAGAGTNSHSGAHSKGANFIVPPGFNNDTYPLGYAETGEHVIIIPRNQTNSNTYNQQRSNQFNINVSAVNSVQSVYQSYRMARLAIQ